MRVTDTVCSTMAHRVVVRIAVIVIGSAMLACRPSDVLTVPPPAGVTPSTAYQNQVGAEGLFTDGKAQVVDAVLSGGVSDPPGLLQWSGLLGDEFTFTFFLYRASDANIDARVTVGTGGFQEGGDWVIETLLKGRLALLSAIPLLEKYEPAAGRSKIGEAFALMGYVELLAAEAYCAGVPLDALGPVQGVAYGTPLTTDSLLGAAAASFDSAATYSGGDATTASLAAVGLARAQLDRGHFAAAAAAASSVPTSFVYNVGLQNQLQQVVPPYAYDLYGAYLVGNACSSVNTADHKGTNGLGYVSAQDPRLVLSTAVAETCDGLLAGSPDSVWYFPVKFGPVYVPLATGIEARLVEAEAALQAHQPGAWATALRALRADSADTHVTFPVADNLPADSAEAASPNAQVDLQFRERAFWLYGTGTRLGDMRRLIRQYGRDQSTVFPVGPYPNAGKPQLPSPLQSYGTDVSLTLPTPASGFTDPNPAYKGCLTSTKTA